ncbi:ATP-binding protein [Methylococcus sp. Mc7]|uniref:ATP-binding protein n=1 Tax=Methylococcus sp. Mc7 TaxID=2860258 RepID=UPI001C52F0D2|nr:ATP-binding protein [Methylococcus sp. Mc7]QXP83912.1 HAMP domain-containing protein [Methylococcus sp. Mc7]
MKRRPSLFRRTALTVAAGLLVFQLAAGLAMFLNLVFPLAYRSADDLAALLVLSARIWTELPPEKRPAFEAELRDGHGLILRESECPLTESSLPYPYLRFLRSALASRLASDQSPRLSEDAHENFQVEFAQGGRLLRFEFSKTRIPPRPSRALVWIVVAGTLATLALSGLLARRVSAPVARLAEAARRIGSGDQPPQLPETGEAELADLARVFNETSRQLQARRENQTTLLAGVSHDLRSPLARMKMAAGLLAEQGSSPLLLRMQRDIVEMDALIGAQLELARAQERENAELTDIDALLGELVEAAEAQAPGRLRLRADGPACRATLAPLALRRSIGNLLDNALRYGGEGEIQVVRRRIKGAIFIGVRDRGPGIPPHLTEAVFRPFYRVESSRSRATGGSGLGLAITRQLAETQGWRVALKARRGGGVCAWLAIP